MACRLVVVKPSSRRMLARGLDCAREATTSSPVGRSIERRAGIMKALVAPCPNNLQRYRFLNAVAASTVDNVAAGHHVEVPTL